MILFVEGLKFFQRLRGDSHTADDYQSTTVVWMARARIVKIATAISITFSAFSLVHLVTVLLNSHLKLVLWTNSCFFPSFQNGSMLGESWTIYQAQLPTVTATCHCFHSAVHCLLLAAPKGVWNLNLWDRRQGTRPFFSVVRASFRQIRIGCRNHMLQWRIGWCKYQPRDHIPR